MYILKISNTAFIKQVEPEMIVTSDYTKSIKFNKIGEAMKAASKLNYELGESIIQLTSVPDNL